MVALGGQIPKAHRGRPEELVGCVMIVVVQLETDHVHGRTIGNLQRLAKVAVAASILLVSRLLAHYTPRRVGLGVEGDFHIGVLQDHATRVSPSRHKSLTTMLTGAMSGDATKE